MRNQVITREGGKNSRYHNVIRIPRGALNIHIEQLGSLNDTNYIALMDDQGQYLLNGKNLITQYPKTFPYGGVTFQYSGAQSNIETVNTTYAIRIEKDLLIQVLQFYNFFY